MSSYPSPDSSLPPPEYLRPAPGHAPYPVYPPPAWRDWVVPGLLFAATLLSTSFAGLWYVVGDIGFPRMISILLTRPSILLLGFPFSLTFLGILLAHELGHYFACRYYGIRCTPPFFIPVPITIAGTLGAFIRIKSPFQHKRALFDVGIAGPLAGFVIVVPALFIGIAHSQLIPIGRLPAGGIEFGEPLIFRWVGQAVLGYSPANHIMMVGPVAMAAWFGLLATCLNLLPIWQLDGGHIAYAVLGQQLQRRLSVVCALGLVGVSFVGWPPSYLLFGALLLFFGWRFRFYHPPTIFEEEDIGGGRRFLGVVALLILIVSFTPVPITLT